MESKQKNEFWSVFQETFETGTEWKLESVEFDDILQEVVICVSFQNESNPYCPICRCTEVKLLPHKETKKGYYSFLGYKTFIHSPEIFVECSSHGKQRIKPPWEINMKKFSYK